jgi:hypothetical protein
MATLSALVSGLDAELRRLVYKDSTRPRTAQLARQTLSLHARERPARTDALCAASDRRHGPHQRQARALRIIQRCP